MVLRIAAKAEDQVSYRVREPVQACGPITISCSAIRRLHQFLLSKRHNHAQQSNGATMSKLNKTILADFETAQIQRQLRPSAG